MRELESATGLSPSRPSEPTGNKGEMDEPYDLTSDKPSALVVACREITVYCPTQASRTAERQCVSPARKELVGRIQHRADLRRGQEPRRASAGEPIDETPSQVHRRHACKRIPGDSYELSCGQQAR